MRMATSYSLWRYHISRILRSANAYKLRGFPVLSIFLVAFSSAFTHCSFFMQMCLKRSAVPFAKDTFYRFMIPLCPLPKGRNPCASL